MGGPLSQTLVSREIDPSDYAPKEFIVQSPDREISRFSQQFLAVSKMFTAVVWRPSPNETNRNESGRDQRAVKANFAACQGHGASRTSRQNAGTASHAD